MGGAVVVAGHKLAMSTTEAPRAAMRAAAQLPMTPPPTT
eukprot:CAMPEP_0180539800 /NCGR_PEP_ID=MMETSP1036_2-20121128/67092_1 /TAXON_ID=632150 /ORGANISM="Azadinium spinosum, Strain 3D9" /LENGTH=38 /DNA_ID= /DNA_START= /DNA_END= /DNA_ORIENTATION=